MSLEPDDTERPPAIGRAAPKSARFVLREATAEAHERLDRLYSSFDLGKPQDYAAFLLAHAPCYIAVERALEAAGAGELVPGWLDRLRSGAIVQDLAELGLAAGAPATAPVFANEAQMLGALYVLEGSRLGGALLVRSVHPGLPTAFLKPGNPADWRAFISLLDLRLSSEPVLADAILAAQAVFDLFEQSARTQLESIDRER